MMDIVRYRQKQGVQDGNMRLKAAHKQTLAEEDSDNTLSDLLGNSKKLKSRGVNIDSMPIPRVGSRAIFSVCDVFFMVV